MGHRGEYTGPRGVWGQSIRSRIGLRPARSPGLSGLLRYRFVANGVATSGLWCRRCIVPEFRSNPPRHEGLPEPRRVPDDRVRGHQRGTGCGPFELAPPESDSIRSGLESWGDDLSQLVTGSPGEGSDRDRGSRVETGCGRGGRLPRNWRELEGGSSLRRTRSEPTAEQALEAHKKTSRLLPTWRSDSDGDRE